MTRALALAAALAAATTAQAKAEPSAADVLGGHGRGSGSGKLSWTLDPGAQEGRLSAIEVTEAAVGTPGRYVGTTPPADPKLARIGGVRGDALGMLPGPGTGGTPLGSGVQPRTDLGAPGAGGRP